MRPGHKLLLAALTAAAPAIAGAQPTLSGMNLFTADADGQAAGGGFWDTVDGGASNLYLTRAPDESFSAGAFINAGQNGDPAFTQLLGLGTNVFYFYGRGFTADYFGLNLFFGGSPTSGSETPDISAFTQTETTVFAPAGPGLVFTSGSYLVTLGNFRLLRTSTNPNAVDRVSVYDVGSDTDPDEYGTFTLNVVDANAPTAVIPEPSTWALLGTGLAGLAGVARRRTQA